MVCLSQKATPVYRPRRPRQSPLYRTVLGSDELLPGAIAGIQTFGELAHYHPHLHVIVTDGAYTPDGTFICLPPMDTDRLLNVWQRKVFDLLLAAEKIDQDLVDQMRAWQHSGFSVDNSVYLPAGDTSGLERLAQYMVRCPFSLSRIVRVTDSGSVVYRAEKADCRRFPTPASRDLAGGARRNFQVFSPLGFPGRSHAAHPRQGRALGPRAPTEGCSRLVLVSSARHARQEGTWRRATNRPSACP